MKTKLLLTLAILLAMSGYYKMTRKIQIIEWEHGFKTEGVIATRYKNQGGRYTIGFRFPGNEFNCDRAEISEFVENNGGSIYEMGGYPGAEVLATFIGVMDVPSANSKIKTILPGLDRLVDSL